MTDFKKWAEGIAGGDRTKIAVTTAHILALRKCACFDSIRKLGGVLIELGAKAPPEAKAEAVGALAKALTTSKRGPGPLPEVHIYIQHTNTQTHKHTNTQTHKHTNTSTYSHITIYTPSGGSRTTVKPQPARSVAKQDVISGAAMQARIKALEKALERETRKRKREEEGRKTEQEQTKKSKKKAKKANKRAEGAEAAAKDAKAALAASESGRAGRSLKRREEDVGRKEEKLKAREAAVEGNEAKRGAVKKLRG
jgi:hypothetical protein